LPGSRSTPTETRSLASSRRFIHSRARRQLSLQTRYLADRELEAYSLDELEAPLARLKEWGAAHGGDSYTFGGDAAPDKPQ
jgi:hypothetical protein